MIEFVTIFLLILLLLAYFTLGRNFSRPSILYIIGFLLCSVVAYNYRKEWGLHSMSSITAFVLVGGAFMFYAVEWYDYKRHPIQGRKIDINSDEFQPISPIKLVIFLVFQLIVFSLLAKERMMYAMTSNLSDALVEYNNDVKFKEVSVRVPFYINHPYIMCVVSRYIWCVLFPYYLFKDKRYNIQKILIFLNLIVGSMGTTLMGGRTGILNDIVTLLSFTYICYYFKTEFRGGLFPRKIMILILAVGLAFSAFFNELGYALGRKESEDPVSIILSIYCGAEIKNLDDFIQHPFKQGNESGLPAQYTLCGMYAKFAYYQGIKGSRLYSPDLRFNDYGNYPLGNVYTTYYNFILDFGIWGAVLFTGVMALIAAFLYRKVINSCFWKNGRLDLWVIFYASLVPSACFLSFFSCKFFESFSFTGVGRDMLYCWIVAYFLQGKFPFFVKKYELNYIESDEY